LCGVALIWITGGVSTVDWLASLRGAIDYMEEHLREPVTPRDIGRAVNLSPFYLQKGFQIVTGYSLREYMRCRRLYMAAMDLLAGEEKVIEVAYKYCYQTPESFAKAFSRFHGFPPSQVKQQRLSVRPFLPLRITISIQGGKDVDYVVEKMESFQLIGFKREIPMDKGYELCPKFWDEMQEKYLMPLWQGKRPETDIERAIVECNIGMFGVCIESQDIPEVFTYYVAGHYDDRPVPKGMALVEIPAAAWAKFRAVGPLPGSLQTLNTQVFREWLPGNAKYDLAFPINLEYYSADENGPDYESAIWLPVIEKG